MAISASLVPGTSALSVLTDWRRSPARVHKSPGRAGARPSRGGPFGRHAPRTAQVPRTPSHLPFRSKSHNSRSRMRFHCVIKSLHRIYSITHEEAETKSNYSSYKKKWTPSINPSTECAISRRNGSDVKSRTFRKMWRDATGTWPERAGHTLPRPPSVSTERRFHVFRGSGQGWERWRGWERATSLRNGFGGRVATYCESGSFYNSTPLHGQVPNL